MNHYEINSDKTCVINVCGCVEGLQKLKHVFFGIERVKIGKCMVTRDYILKSYIVVNGTLCCASRRVRKQ